MRDRLREFLDHLEPVLASETMRAAADAEFGEYLLPGLRADAARLREALDALPVAYAPARRRIADLEAEVVRLTREGNERICAATRGESPPLLRSFHCMEIMGRQPPAAAPAPEAGTDE